MSEPPPPTTTDWRERLHQLPSGVEKSTGSIWITLPTRFVFYSLLAVAGLICSTLAGPLIGLQMGVSSEHSGSYLLIGATFTTLVGGLLAVVLKRRGHPRTGWFFYAFTLPTLVIFLIGAFG